MEKEVQEKLVSKVLSPIPVKDAGDRERVYSDSDMNAAKQLYFRLTVKDRCKKISTMLNFPIELAKEWEKNYKWKEQIKKNEKNIKNNLKDLRNPHAIVRDNMLIISAYEKKLKDYISGKEKISGTDLKTITELLEKQNKGVLGEDIKTAGQVVILMDRESYNKMEKEAK